MYTNLPLPLAYALKSSHDHSHATRLNVFKLTQCIFLVVNAMVEITNAWRTSIIPHNSQGTTLGPPLGTRIGRQVRGINAPEDQ